MIELGSGELSLRLDPGHGAEIIQLRERSSGRELLGRPPFAPAPAVGGDLDEETWTASYRGGWQVLAPNAGNACRLAGVDHGFHGRASVDPWELLDRDGHSATLRWRGHGLELTRRVAIEGRTVHVALSWTATAGESVPLVAVEHICFGREILDPQVILLASARAREVSEVATEAELAAEVEVVAGAGDSVRPSPLPASWPEATLLDGTVEEAGTWPLARERARLLVLSGFPEGVAEVRNAHTGWGARLEWDASRLPHAWLWHEVRASGGLWDRRTELLGFEPASVPHTRGLAEAVANGQAHWAHPGREGGHSLRMTVLAA